MFEVQRFRAWGLRVRVSGFGVQQLKVFQGLTVCGLGSQGLGDWGLWCVGVTHRMRKIRAP